jgi:hypothetical protein
VYPLGTVRVSRRSAATLPTACGPLERRVRGLGAFRPGQDLRAGSGLICCRPGWISARSACCKEPMS